MRLRHKKSAGQLSKSSAEPVAEGILREPKRRHWNHLDDEGLVKHCQRFIEENGIKNPYGLKTIDSGLYQALRKRELLDSIGFEKRRETREWGADENVLETARKTVEENGISNRSGLAKADPGLYDVLRHRKLLDFVCFKERTNRWGKDEEVLGFARKEIEKEGIMSRNGLKKADPKLYTILRNRKLLHLIGLVDRVKQGKWGTDAEVLKIARDRIEGDGIRNRSGLEKADGALYAVLKRRDLLDSIRFEKRPRQRNWGTDGEVLEFAASFIAENGIDNRSQLGGAYPGLYAVLNKRKLLDSVIFKERELHRKWGPDQEVLAVARHFIQENGIRNRIGLEEADCGLYNVLRLRRLLDFVGLDDKRQSRNWGDDEEVLAIARKLIEEKGIMNRKMLEKVDRGLLDVLSKRKLLDSIRFEKRQQWRRWGTDGEVLGFARKLMEEKGIRSPSGLERVDSGLHAVLMKRKLLDSLEFDEKRETRKYGTDEEVLGLAQKLIDENGIKSPSGLNMADSGLHQVLLRRGLVDLIKFEKRQIQQEWGSREEILEIASRFIEENKIRRPSDLDRVNKKLYQALWRRQLLDTVFAPIRQRQETEDREKGLQEIAEALEEFGRE